MAVKTKKTHNNIVISTFKFFYQLVLFTSIFSILGLVMLQLFVLEELSMNLSKQNDILNTQLKEIHTWQINFEKKVFSTNQKTTEVKPPAPDDKDHVLGDTKNKYSLVVYVDYECPFCKQANPIIKGFQAQNSAELNLIYRHYPLENIHPFALKKSQIVECAYLQSGLSGFWRATDAIYSTSDISTISNEQLANILDLDAASLSTCMSENQTLSFVKSQQKAGLDAGVPGTPSLYLYEKNTDRMQSIEGVISLDDLQNKFNSFKASK